jgi:hypothetical protein
MFFRPNTTRIFFRARRIFEMMQDDGRGGRHRRFRGLGSQKVSPRRTAYNGTSSRRKRQSRYRCMLSNTVRAWIRSTVLWPLVNQP